MVQNRSNGIFAKLTVAILFPKMYGAWECAYTCASARLVLLTQHLIACAVLPSTASLTSPYLSMLSYKLHGFLQKVSEHKMCVFIFSTTFA
jgi:hypothetical protein